MHENILHNFLFKNFIFLVSLVILVRDFVLSRCLLSLRLTRRSKVKDRYLECIKKRIVTHILCLGTISLFLFLPRIIPFILAILFFAINSTTNKDVDMLECIQNISFI